MIDIVSALQSGNLPVAESLCRERLRSQPRNEDLLVLLALCLHHQGRAAEAVEVHQELTIIFPQSSLHWGNLATAMRSASRISEAIEAVRRGLALAPNDPELLDTFGTLQLQQREYLGAREALFKAHAIKPDSAEIAIHAAQACIACRDYRADELIQSWRNWLPLDDGPQMDLAHTLLTLGDATAALELLENLVHRTPSHLPALALLTSVYERVNRVDDARSLLQQIRASHGVLDAQMTRELGHQDAKLSERSGDYAQAHAILDLTGPRTPVDYDHYFVLAQICDKLGDMDGALAALKTAHALQIEDLAIATPHRFEADAPIFPAATHKVSAEEYSAWPILLAPDAAQSPVFIVGFPRSGTTLLEQMLDAHPDLQSMDERPFFNILGDRLADADIHVPQDIGSLNQRDCDQLRKDYLDLVCAKIPRRFQHRLIDKNPLNMLWLPLIHRLFPYARFILALRHPADVLVSNYMQNFRSSVLGAACRDVEVLARAYVTAMEYWLHHVDVFRPSVFVSRYESLVEQPELQTERLAGFLEIPEGRLLLGFDARARAKGYIATPSYTQVIEPINRKSVDRWRRYQHLLEPAMPILEPMLTHWGYGVDQG